MRALRLEPRYGRDLDALLIAIPRLTLVRCRAGTFVVDVSRPEALARSLAFQGIEARTDAGPSLGAEGVLLECADLRPVPRDLVVSDTVHVDVLPLGPATREVLHRRLPTFRAPSPQARSLCAALLSAAEAMYAWRRLVVVAPDSVRDVRARARARRVARDVGLRETDSRRALTSTGLLATWAFD